MAPQTIVIKGLVIPAAWDAKGNPRKICIAAFDETEYLVAGDRAAKELLTHIHRRVVVVGRLVDSDAPMPTIEVEDFRPISPEEGSEPPFSVTGLMTVASGRGREERVMRG